MRSVERRDLAWAERAPLVVQATARSAAPPDAVFAELADHERWPEWFASVRSVEVIGERAGVGARRRVRIPGAVFDEEFIAWDPGVRWSFTVFASRPRLARSLVEDCRLAPTPDGGTEVDYRMCFDPTPWAAPVMRLVAGRMRAQLQAALDELVRRAERAG